MVEVGVRALKDQLSRLLRRASRGERVVVTDRGRPIAVISAVEEGPEAASAWDLVRQGRARWSGGKPTGAMHPPVIPGPDRAQLVLGEETQGAETRVAKTPVAKTPVAKTQVAKTQVATQGDGS